ncbi:MAG: sulfotransferase family 2 domain-containing protein [Prochlorococcaceae cyanobacterium]
MDQTIERTIILHYHLFKNAGTSVDAILKRNFGDRWVTREFPAMGGNNTELVERWIRETPDAVAYSSHTMMGPIPEVEGVRVISFMLLRDPIERIKSAYRFERTQQADTWGAQLAKECDFSGYVLTRSARSGDRQCRSFQTHRMASLCPGGESELDSAISGMLKLSLVGLVDEFTQAMLRLKLIVSDYYPDFNISTVHHNASIGSTKSLDDDTIRLLEKNNQADFILLEAARDRIEQMLAPQS